MIPNDSVKNYFFLRKKMFRINKNVPGLNKTVLQNWTKSTFFDDFPKDKLNEVIVYESPEQLPKELLSPYINYLELKVYNWGKLSFIKE